jgi:hypothetical protein
MKLTVWIDGREAVPVRAIPYVTNWNISPDMLVSAFSGESVFRPAISAVQTFRKNGGVVSQIQNSGWERLRVQIDGLAHRLQHDAVGRAAWEEESVKLLPHGIFVWLEDFVSAFSSDFSPASRIPDDRGDFPYLDFSPLLPNGLEEIVFHGFDRSSNHTAPISYISAATAIETLRSRIKGISAKEFELFVESGFLRAIDSDGESSFDEREISEFVPRKRFFAFEDLVERWEDRAGGRQGAINLISEQVERKRLSLYGGKNTRRPVLEDALFSFGEIVLAESGVELSDERCRVLAGKRLASGNLDVDQSVHSWKNQRIGWKKSVVSVWPSLLERHRRKPTVEELVAELERNADREGYIVPSGVPDELKWRQVKNRGGEPKPVRRDTIEDFIGSLPGYRA